MTDHVHTRSAGQDMTRSCPSCGSGQSGAMSGYEADRLVRCSACRLVFAAGRPSDADLTAHYSGYGTAWFDSPLTRVRYAELLDSFAPYRRTGRILDFGSGAGYFVEEAQRRGWEACGIEFGTLALQMAAERGLDVRAAPLTEETFPPGHFDVVTAFEVIEHLRDPLDDAQAIARVLRPGGLFYCTTPNFNAVTRRLLRARWSSIGYPEHLSYFTTRTLAELLGRVGLRRATITSTGFSPTAVRRGLAPAAARPVPGESGDERLRQAAEQSAVLGAAKHTVNRALTVLRAGDTLKGRFELAPR